jgi:hypothetical protein
MAQALRAGPGLTQPTPPFNPQAMGGMPNFTPGAGLPPQAQATLPPQAMGGGMPGFTPGAGLPPQAQATLPAQAMGGMRPAMPTQARMPTMPPQVPMGRGRR